MGIMTSIGSILRFLLEIYSWLIIARVLISWVSPDPYNPVVQFLVRATEPIMAPMRRLLPAIGGLDLSPILAIFLVMALQRIVTILFSPMAGGSGAVLMLLAEFVYLIHLLFTFYLLILVIRAGVNIFNWYNFRRSRGARLDLYNPFIRFIYASTEPVLRTLRRVVPNLHGLDISPILGAILTVVALILLQEAVIFLASPPGSGGGVPMMMPQ